MEYEDIIREIQMLMKRSAPKAKVILYGSYARGDYHQNSDIDLLILAKSDKLSRKEIKKIKYPLYELAFETGQIISPLVISEKEWETKHSITTFYDNIQKEGKLL